MLCFKVIANQQCKIMLQPDYSFRDKSLSLMNVTVVVILHLKNNKTILYMHPFYYLFYLSLPKAELYSHIHVYLKVHTCSMMLYRKVKVDV